MKKSELTTFGKRLREMRLQLELTLEELGIILGGKTKTVISLWEGDKNFPTIQSFMQLCTFFRCDPHWLYRGESNPKFDPKTIPKDKHLLGALMYTLTKLEELTKKMENITK